jgi:hypothetical protein
MKDESLRCFHYHDLMSLFLFASPGKKNDGQWAEFAGHPTAAR